MKSDEQYGPVGKRILFENDLVRVWEISLGPGEHLLQHYHALPYLVVTIEAAHVRVVEHDGRAYDPIDAPGFSPRAKNDGAKGLLVGAQSPVQQSQDAIAFPILGKDTRRSHCA